MKLVLIRFIIGMVALASKFSLESHFITNYPIDSIIASLTFILTSLRKIIMH